MWRFQTPQNRHQHSATCTHSSSLWNLCGEGERPRVYFLLIRVRAVRELHLQLSRPGNLWSYSVSPLLPVASIITSVLSLFLAHFFQLIVELQFQGRCCNVTPKPHRQESVSPPLNPLKACISPVVCRYCRSSYPQRSFTASVCFPLHLI